MSFFGELRRRNVVKVAVAYAIVGWLLIEVSTTVLPLFAAPDWIAQVFAFFVILGFPLALVLSWAYELTPEGIKLERDVAAGESITHSTGRKIDFAIIGALVLALGFVLYTYVLEDAEVSIGLLPNSVAVLPFRNDSPDSDNAYYASGIHEEILNHLVKLSSLSVIARTSVEPYADTDKSIPEIASELNVETVMEGSVRYANGQIRITAQLNDGITGAHLWSETYTRDFEDIFAIESDVAMNVANALEAEFSLEEQVSLEKRPTESTAAYLAYLRAKSQHEDADAWKASIAQAVRLDPNFALAYADIAGQYAVALSGTVEDWEQIARENANKALSIDPTLTAPHLALAQILQTNWRWSEAQQMFERAYQANPNAANVLNRYGRFLRIKGEYAKAIELIQRGIALDPADSYIQLGIAYKFARDYEAAVTALQITVEKNPTAVNARIHLADSEIARGNHAEGLRQLIIAEQLSTGIAYRLGQMMLAYAQLDRPDDVRRIYRQLEERAEVETVGDATWAMGHLALGDTDRALQYFESAVESLAAIDSLALGSLKGNFWPLAVLEERRFRVLRDQIGALD